MNSSSSSSINLEYELIDNDNFLPYFYGRTAFHSTLAQPLVYYAEVKPKKRNQRSKDNERYKSNCFVKAFRWYTQEHVPFAKNEPSNNVEENSFANWLDEKYNEYLQKNQNEQSQVLGQSSTREIVNAANNFENKQKAAEEYSKINSPWKKRRKTLSANDKADVKMAVSSKSIQIILRPKNLSRPASACCQRIGTKCCCRTNSQKQCGGSTLLYKSKSQSFTSVLTEKEIFIVPYDITQDTSLEKLKHNTYETKSNNNEILEQMLPKKDNVRIVNCENKKDVSCQCSKISLEKIDACSQFEKKVSCLCVPKSKIDVSKKISVIPKSKHLSNTTYQKTNSMNVENIGHPPKIFATQSQKKNNGGVQTSDNSIKLGHDNYPLFMKMICVHK